ncbi:hypothetical protein B566_EDAN007375 [Ephemera danica]|nr:hypothetical protein B566_EDAN007375 [Ephemera danica]
MSKNQRNYRKRSFSSSEEDESTLWNPSRTDRSSPDLSRQNSSHHRSQHESTSRQRIDQELFQLRVRSHYLLQDPNRDARNGPQPPKKARKSHREAADYMMSPPRDWSRAERSCLGYKRKAPPDGGKWQHDMWQWQDNPGGNNSAQPNDWESNSRGPVQNRDGNNSAQPNNWESNSRGPVQNRDGNNSAQPNDWESNSRPASQGLNRSFPLPCVPPSTQASATEMRPASPIKYKIFNARGVIPGMKLLVKPSVVSNLDSIYLWNEQWDQQLLSLQSQVASHACQPGGVAMKLDVGDACLAKHLGIWFRATVLAKPANGMSLFVALETTKGLKFSVVLYDGQMCINQIFGAKPHSLLPCMTLPYQPSPAGNAIISYFINPGLFSIHLTCQKYTMSNMERQIEEMDPTLKLQTADKGELVLAPRHNAYHRARVLDVMKISELLPMPDSLKQVGPLRYDVKLVGVEPTNGLQWAEKCPKTDQIFLSHPDFELITAVKPSDEELWQVELKQPGTTSTLSELLIRSQIANKALTGTFAAGGLLQVRVSYFQTSPTLTIHLQEKNRQMNLEALQAKLKSLNLSSANPHIPVFGSGALAAAR